MSLARLVGSWSHVSHELAGKQYRDAYNYLRKRIRFLDYWEYRRNHLPIGSGVTEAVCKTVFTQRLKESGMTWSLEGGQ